MQELIKIQQHDKLIQTVDARELHAFLESKQDFSTWIKNRIEKNKFVENQDFVSHHKIVERATGGTKRKEYALSIEMAKHIAMLEQNDKGFQARQYFIECEKEAKKLLPKSYKAALLELIAKEEEREQLEAENNSLRQTFGASHIRASCIAVKLATGVNYENKWRALKAWCDKNGTAPEKVPHPGLGDGTVNAYPAGAWKDVYNVDLNDLFGKRDLMLL